MIAIFVLLKTDQIKDLWLHLTLKLDCHLHSSHFWLYSCFQCMLLWNYIMKKHYVMTLRYEKYHWLWGNFIVQQNVSRHKDRCVCVCMRVILDVCNTSVCLHPAPLYSSHSLYCSDSAEAWLLGAHGFHITAEGGGGMKNKTWQLDTRYHPLSEMLCEIRGLRPCFKRWAINSHLSR